MAGVWPAEAEVQVYEAGHTSRLCRAHFSIPEADPQSAGNHMMPEDPAIRHHIHPPLPRALANREP